MGNHYVTGYSEGKPPALAQGWWWLDTTATQDALRKGVEEASDLGWQGPFGSEQDALAGMRDAMRNKGE